MLEKVGNAIFHGGMITLLVILVVAVIVGMLLAIIMLVSAYPLLATGILLIWVTASIVAFVKEI